MSRWILVALFALSMTGCRKQEEVPSPPIQEPELPEQVPPDQVLWQEVRTLHEASDTNGVLARLELALVDPELQESRPNILRELLAMNLWMGRVDAAREKFLEVAAGDMVLAGNVFGLIEQNYLRAQEYDQAILWSRDLLAMPFPEATRARSFGFIIEAYRAQDDVDSMLAAFTECAAELPTDNGLAIIRQVLNALLRGKQFEELDRSLAYLDENLADKPGFPKVIAGMRLWSRINQDQLDAAIEVLEASTDLLPDADRAGPLDAILRKARSTGRQDLATELCARSMDANPVDSRVFQTAARHWVLLAKEADDAELTVERLSSLMARNAPTSLLISLLDQTFYFTVERGELPTRKIVLDTCEKLRARDVSDREKSRLGSLILDACFMVEDFDRAVALLENDMPEMEAERRDMLLPKVRAHASLAAGRTEEAIGLFRQFMALVATDEDSVTDPFSGAKVSQSYILGFNEARIGRLWAEIGQQTQSEAAYTEADRLLNKALEDAEADSIEYHEIQKALLQIAGERKNQPKTEEKDTAPADK